MLNLIKPPALQTGNGLERHSTWLELLYDLIFVAAVAQLASTLNINFTPRGGLHFAFLIIPVWWAWIGHTFYMTRFDTDDIVHRLLSMLQMIAVASMAINVPGALGSTSNAFALSYASVRCILVLEYLRAGRHVPEARPLTKRYSIGFGVALLLWVFSVLLPAPFRFLLWCVAIAIDFLTPLTAKTIHFRFPPHQMHLPERFGLFTIIVIGEAVAGVVAGLGQGGVGLLSSCAGIMGLIIAFTFWWAYFEAVQGASLRIVESFEHVSRYQLWLYAHLPLVMGITATAVGVRHVIALPFLQPLPQFEALIFSSAVGASSLALNGIFLAAYPADRSRELHRFLIPHYIIALLGITTGFLGGKLPGIAILAILMALCLAQIFFTFKGRPA